MTDIPTGSPGPDPVVQPPPPPAPAEQPAWQAPPGAPAPAASTGLDPKIAGLLSYLLGWVGGLIMYLTQKDPEVRFHGAQSILLSIAFFVVYVAMLIVTAILGQVPVLGWILGLLVSLVLWVGGLALFVYMAVQGYNLNHVKLPVIGDMAEQWASKPA
jgi:uncharacterized membrane protein